MKFYADMNKRHLKIENNWNECLRLNKEKGGLNFKSFKTYEEARDFLQGAAATGSAAAVSKPTNLSIPADAGIIGSDEVGKVEPFKQLMVVAVYADPDADKAALASLDTGDSKLNIGNREKIMQLGYELTGFEMYDEIKDQVYTNDRYGLIYYIKIITNEVYNFWESKNSKARRYGNAVLAYAHNEAIRRVCEEVKRQGRRLSHIVVDDFIATSAAHDEQFKTYTSWIDPAAASIADIPDAELVLTDHAENKFPHTVGTASNIGDYVDKLWHEKVMDEFAMVGIDFSEDWFNNFKGQADIDRVFALIADKCGDIDNSPVTMKHTKYYKEWKTRH